MNGFAAALFALVLITPPAAYAWGLGAHRFINEAAIETLPEPLRSFYRLHREELSDAAVAPDLVLRKRDGHREGMRHYLRLENFGAEAYVLGELTRKEAERRFGKRKFSESGVLPWVVVDHARGIERSMRRGDWATAIRTSGYGGHYLSDGYMPLHTTADFDGQKSIAGPGLHEALERDVVDHALRTIVRRVRASLTPARETPFTQRAVMTLLTEIHADVAPLVAAHVEAHRAGRVETRAYLAVLRRKCLAILERRLGEAVGGVGSLWLSAWVAAGRPEPPAAR